MQASTKSIEREALRRIPHLLAELLDEPNVELVGKDSQVNSGIDLLARDAQGRRWAFEFKASSRPGQVDQAARQLDAVRPTEAIPVLVVPFMSKAGAERLSGRSELDRPLRQCPHPGRGPACEGAGKAREFRTAGRPSSPSRQRAHGFRGRFCSNRRRWWRQKDLADATHLDDGNVSRVVRRLDEEALLERRDRRAASSRPRPSARRLGAGVPLRPPRRDRRPSQRQRDRTRPQSRRGPDRAADRPRLHRPARRLGDRSLRALQADHGLRRRGSPGGGRAARHPPRVQRGQYPAPGPRRRWGFRRRAGLRQPAMRLDRPDLPGSSPSPRARRGGRAASARAPFGLACPLPISPGTAAAIAAKKPNRSRRRASPLP